MSVTHDPPVNASRGGPLAGIRIIEFAGLGPGPFCAMMLADHGADVVRVDRLAPSSPLPGDPRDDFLNRSRRGIGIDLKSPAGIALARRLCAGADGLIEGFRPGVMERLGLGPEVLLAAQPAMIYGRMTGWGQDGPYAAAAGHDINYVALSGALHGIGRAGQKPVPPMNLIGDFGGGGMMLAFGIVAALLHARSTGIGQVIDCAMTEGSAVLMTMIYSLQAQGIWSDRRGSNMLDGGAHYYDSYETSDGLHIALGAVEPHFYHDLLARLGLSADEELKAQNDPSKWPAQQERFEALFRSRTRAHWCEVLEGSDACFAPILSLQEAPKHPHNVARRAFAGEDSAPQPAPAPRFSATPSSPPRPLSLDEGATASILSELGLSEREIADLRDEGVVG